MATVKTTKTASKKVTSKASSKTAAVKKAVKAVAKKAAPKKVVAQKAIAISETISQTPSTGIEVLAHAGEGTTHMAEPIDAGWVFYFSVHAADVNSAWGIMADKLMGKAVRTGKLSATDYFADEFTPRMITQRGDLFVLRTTPDSTEDLGMLAGEIEDAFRDANIRPGPMLADTRTIEGVQYTFYRNETDLDGRVLLPSELAEMRKANPFTVMYNPFGKTDPWDDMYYEYTPSVEEEIVTEAFGAMEPTKEARLPMTLDVEDFDHDLGNLLNKVFTGVSAKYLTQPEGVRGWVFDKGLGRAGKPSYRFYACHETIKPVRKTLAAAGFNYTPDKRGDWYGVQLPFESFKTVQRTLSDPKKLKELKSFFQASAQTNGDEVPALPPPEDLPFADDTLFVSEM